jgi:hypothetical protein
MEAKYKLCVAVLFSVMLLEGISSAALQLQVDAQKYEPYPAQTDQYLNLWVHVKNIGTTSPTGDMTFSVVSSYPFSADASGAETVTSLDPYEDAVVQFKNIRVAPDALEGWNKLKIEYKAFGTSVIKEFDIYIKSMSAKLAVGSLTTAPSEILPDTDKLELDLELQNVGNGNAEMVTGKLALPAGFTASDSYSNSYNFGTVGKDSSKTGKFYVDVDAGLRSGAYEANLTLQYKEESNGDFTTVTLPVILNVKPSPVFVIEKTSVDVSSRFGGPITAYAVVGTGVVTPSSLAQGETGELRITVKNTGDEAAKSTSVRVFKQSDQPFEFDTKYDYIGDLQPNQTADAVFSFTIDQSAPLKTYLLSAEIRHVDGEDVKVTEQPFTIDVASQKENPILLYGVILIIVIVVAVMGWKHAKKK